LGAPFAFRAAADTYPSRNPRLIVPFPAGGPTDVLARIAAERVSPGLGQPLIVENRSGAGGNLAGELAARNEADGYTLLVAGQAILAINKALYKKLSYDPATDFAFVGMLGVIANVLLVNPTAVPVNSLNELIALARRKPGDISYGSNGPGSLTHLTTAILAHQASVDLLHVPYQGAAPLMTDLLAGRISMTFTAASAALPLVQSGQLRALAVTTGQRSRFSPDIPTLVESGFPNLDAPTWFGVVVRAATPASILARLRSEFNAVITSEGYSKALEKNSMEILPVAADASDQFLARERQLWSDAVRIAGVALD
jgi:tripartite-type tricarboxylate transporter receptor subunit TctC